MQMKRSPGIPDGNFNSSKQGGRGSGQSLWVPKDAARDSI